MPTIDQLAASKLKEVVSTRLISDDEINNIVEPMPVIGNIISISSFHDTCVEIHNNSKQHRKILGSCEHHVKRGMMHNAVSRVYSDNIHMLAAPDTTYEQWFADRNIDIESFSGLELEAMQKEVVQEATGLSLNTGESLANLQAAMIGMFKQLSSYSVQFIADVKGNGIIRLDTPAVRVGDVTSTGENLQYYPFKIMEVKKYFGQGVNTIKYNLSKSNTTDTKVEGITNVKLDTSVGPHSVSVLNVNTIKVNIVSTRVKIKDDFVSSNTHTVTVPGTELSELLTRQELNSTGNIYNNGFILGESTDYMVHDYVDDGYVNNELSTLPNPDLSKAVILSPIDGAAHLTPNVTIDIKPMTYYGNSGSKLKKVVLEVYDAADDWAGPVTDLAGAIVRINTVLETDNPLTYTFAPLFLSGYMGTNKVLHVRVKYIDDAARHSEWSEFVKMYFALY